MKKQNKPGILATFLGYWTVAAGTALYILIPACIIKFLIQYLL